MANRLAVDSFIALKHRLLNTYVHNYKDKLCLANIDEEVCGVKNPSGTFSLTIDFNELVKLKQATEEAGWDPYTQFMKMRAG